MVRRRAVSGMTLLEVMLAASLMAGVVALILTGYSRMAAASSAARQYRQAAELLKYELSQVYGTADPTTLQAQGNFADLGTISTPLQGAAWLIEVTSIQTGLSQVKVTVTWQSNRGPETVSASTLKFMPQDITTSQTSTGQTG